MSGHDLNTHAKHSMYAMLMKIPIVLLLVFANVFIACATAGTVLLQLLSTDCNKQLALVIAIGVAIATHTYIVFNHRLRDLIKKGEPNE